MLLDEGTIGETSKDETKLTPLHAMKGAWGRKGIAFLFLNLGTRRG
jgi:hypothetical protein